VHCVGVYHLVRSTKAVPTMKAVLVTSQEGIIFPGEKNNSWKRYWGSWFKNV